jgi:hypothetical protein
MSALAFNLQIRLGLRIANGKNGFFMDHFLALKSCHFAKNHNNNAAANKILKRYELRPSDTHV